MEHPEFPTALPWWYMRSEVLNLILGTFLLYLKSVNNWYLLITTDRKEEPHKLRNRQISRRIRRPPSRCAGNEMAAGISIMVLEFYIPGVRSPGEKIPPRLHPSGWVQARCAGAKPGSGTSLVRFTVSIILMDHGSGLRPRWGIGKETILRSCQKMVLCCACYNFGGAPACHPYNTFLL